MSTTSLIGLILVAVIVIPVILLNHNKNKKNAAIKKKLADMSRNAIISNQEFWNGYLIAIDEIDKKCFYVHQEDSCCKAETIDLTKYSSCRVVSSSMLGTSSTSIDLVELVFTPKDKESENKSLVFFNAETDGFCLNGELQSAERWRKICSNLIK